MILLSIIATIVCLCRNKSSKMYVNNNEDDEYSKYYRQNQNGWASRFPRRDRSNMSFGEKIKVGQKNIDNLKKTRKIGNIGFI